MDKILFAETQRFSRGWSWFFLMIAVFAVLLPFGYGIYSQEILKVPFGDNPMSTTGLIVFGSVLLIVMVLVLFYFIRSRMETKITKSGVEVLFPPLLNKAKKITADEIQKFEVRNYNAIWEFGGYGIKSRFQKGLAYIVSGNVGLQLYLKNGKKILIGTQQKQSVVFALEKMMKEENSD